MPLTRDVESTATVEDGARVITLAADSGTIVRAGGSVCEALGRDAGDLLGTTLWGIPIDGVKTGGRLPGPLRLAPHTIGLESAFLVDAADGDRRRLVLTRIAAHVNLSLATPDSVDYFVTNTTLPYLTQVAQSAVIGGLVAELDAATILGELCAEVELICRDTHIGVADIDLEGRAYAFSTHSMSPDIVQGFPRGEERGHQLPVAPGFFDDEVVAHNLATAPGWGELGRRLNAHGYKTAWSLPIVGHTRATSGAFTFYSQNDVEPTPLRRGIARIVVSMAAMVLGRDRVNTRARRAIIVDPVTQLPNRAGAAARIEGMIDEIQPGEQFAVALYDLDRFNTIQEVHGHRVGELVIRAIAEKIGGILRPEDVLAHTSGSSEFIVVMHGFSREDALDAVRLNIGLTEDPLEIGDRRLYGRGHVGISVYPRDGEDFETLMQNAGVALHEARKTPGVLYCAFSGPLMSSRMREDALIGETLETAIDEGQLSLVFQPQVRVTSWGGSTVHTELYGVEALLRWEHPELGAVNPELIATAAEEVGLSDRLTRWVISRATRQLAEWRASGMHVPRIAVNLSTPDVYDTELADFIDDLLRERDIPPADLVLELTERIALSDVGGNLVCLDDLQRRGFPLALDDFGTGYSTLIHLSELPIAELKVDKMFVQQQLPGEPLKPLLRWIPQLASAMKVAVVVEGVETEAQRDILLGAGYTVFQGYLFARPMSGSQLPGWVAGLG